MEKVRFFVNKTAITYKWSYQSLSILQRKFNHIYPAQSFQDRPAPTHSANTPLYVKFEDLKRNEKTSLAFLFLFVSFPQLIMETPLEDRQDPTDDESNTFFSQIIVPPSLLDKLETVMKKK